jgi:hypothetical protein
MTFMRTWSLPPTGGDSYAVEVTWFDADDDLAAGFGAAYYEPGARRPDMTVEPEECPTLLHLILRLESEVDWNRVPRPIMKQLSEAQGRREHRALQLLSAALA